MNLISAMVNRRTNVQIIPRISFRLPSMMSEVGMRKSGLDFPERDVPSDPMFVSLTPRELMNSRARFTFSAF